MKEILRTQGIVLGKEDFGEKDRFYFIFTKDFGYLKIFAKGIRKIEAKLKSAMELFNLVRIEFVQGRLYQTLTDAFILENFSFFKKDLKRVKIAFKIKELFAKLIKGQEKEEKIFKLLKETFEKLNNQKIKISSLPLLYYYFFWNFVSFLGYKPQIKKCSFCQKELKGNKIFWSSQRGGILCQICAKKNKRKIEISHLNLKLLRLILKENLEFLVKIKTDFLNFQELKKITSDYLNFIKAQ